MIQDKKLLLLLSHIPNISEKSLLSFARNCRVPVTDSKALFEVLMEQAPLFSIDRSAVSINKKAAIERTKQALDLMGQNDISYSGLFDSTILAASQRSISLPPLVLYYKGEIEQMGYERFLCITGTRTPTDYGISIAKKLGTLCGSSNKTILITGLSLGVETAATLGAIDANGTCIAVLAGNLVDLQPQQNKQLVGTILETGGLILSSISPVSTMQFRHLDTRNSLLAQLSSSVCLIESKEESMVMNTVAYAIGAERSIYAFDPPSDKVTEKMTGNKLLLKSQIAQPFYNKESIKFI